MKRDGSHYWKPSLSLSVAYGFPQGFTYKNWRDCGKQKWIKAEEGLDNWSMILTFVVPFGSSVIEL